MKPKLIYKHVSKDLDLTIIFDDQMNADRFVICGNDDHDEITDEMIATAADFGTPEGFELKVDLTGKQPVFH